MEIRKTTMADWDVVMELYARARRFMKENGNPDQWGDTDPKESLIKNDIEAGKSYVCEQDGRIVAVFFYSMEIEPTYHEICDGAWLNDRPYGVVHRITSSGEVKGAASFCIGWAYEQCKNLRIDTHRDNIPMQRTIAKNGFTYCGIVHMANGSERLAYQKCR